MRTIALDLGAKSVSWCEVRGGEVVRRGTVSSAEDLWRAIAPPPARVAFEACREAWHVHDLLRDSGYEPVMVDTTRVRQLGVGQHGRKNDRLDAEVLARALERGWLPQAHVLSDGGRRLRELQEVHRCLVRTRASATAHARELARGRGRRLPGCAPEDLVARVREQPLDEETRAVLEPLLQTLDPLHVRIAQVEQRISALCESATDPIVQRLASVHGVALTVAAAYVSVIDDARRFHHAGQVVSYLGLAPREDTTGGPDRQRLGAITKKGNRYARAMLVQAAWCIVRSHDTSDPLVRWAHAVVRRRGKSRAAVAVARRLARLLWALWRDGTYYDPQQVADASSRGMQEHGDRLQQQAIAMKKAATKLRRQRRLSDARAAKEVRT